MDTGAVVAAIQNAIANGAVLAPPIPGTHPASDMNLIRAQTSIGLDPDKLDAYINELRVVPEMAKFDSTFANVPHGGGISIGLSNIAQLVLACSIATNDVGGTVARFADYIATNSTTVTAVMAISGVKTDREVKLGPDISLIPLESLPPSMQRGIALGQEFLSPNPMRLAIPSALITNVQYSPVFYRPSEGGVPSRESQARITAAQHLLDEARTVLGILGTYPAYRMFWAQAADPLMAAGVSSGWQSSSQGYYGTDSEIEATSAEALAASYFALPQGVRNKVLRIPLDRLNRSAREYDFADRAIDLGISLEALLLHDLGNQDRGELKFRLSLRGTWLGGTTDSERASIQKSLKDLYDLRSRAVHAGSAEHTDANFAIINHGTELCRLLIKKVMDAKCRVDWNALVLGAASSDDRSE